MSFINKKTTLLLAILTSLTLTACDKFQSPQVKCDDEASKSHVKQIFLERITTNSTSEIKTLINEGETLSTENLKFILDKLDVSLSDVRTTHADSNSKKQSCEGTLSIKFTEDLISDANATRKIVGRSDVHQEATLDQLKFENNTLNYNLAYTVQPTDDGQKLYTNLDNAQRPAQFTTQIVVDILRRAPLERAEKAMEEEIKAEEKRIEKENAEYEKTQSEYQAVLIKEAKQALDNANARLNLVWQATSKEIRSQLLEEQRTWLKKRDLECKLISKNNASEAPEQEVLRLQCETEMTDYRTDQLRHIIYQMEN